MAEFRQDPSMGESTTSKPTGATAPTLVTSPTGLPLCRSSVLAAHELIKPHIHRTPVLTSRTLDKLASLDHEVEGYIKFNLFFKAECFQKIGAFKYRGARHALERLLAGGDGGGGASGVNGRRSPAETLREKGVVTHSSGNHAQALALAASELSIPCHVVMPSISTPSKIAATGGYGANIVFSGSTSQEREAVVAEVQAATGAVLVPPYDHPDIMCGQGTMALELIQQVEELQSAAGADKIGLDAIIAPCGGGGMLSGIAIACQGTGIKVFGAEPLEGGADDCARGLLAGKRIRSVKTLTIADGLRTPVGEWPWKVISSKDMIEGVFAVTEEEILKAMKFVIERMKILIEPSSAVPVAVVLYNKEFRALVRNMWPAGVNLGIVLSGGNTTLERVGELFAQKNV